MTPPGSEHFEIVDATGDFDIYGRLSNEKNGKVVTVAEQVAKVRAAEEAKGYRLRAIWSDDGISAYDPNAVRPGFLALCAAIKTGDTPKRIATREDARFARQTTVGSALIALAANAGVTLVMGGREVDPDDPVSQGMAEVAFAFASIDSKIKSKNIRIAHEVMARTGKWAGGPRRFGYLKDGVTPDEGGIEGRPAEAPLYRELIARLGRGESPATIADDWKARGVRTMRGTCFTTAHLRILALSPRHSGQRVFRGKVIGMAEWPGLVTPDEQARVRALFAGRFTARATRGTGAAASRGPTLVQGLAHCALCGSKMALGVKDKGKTRIYRCPSTKGDACGGTSIHVRLLDAEVEGQFLARLTDPGTQRMLAEQQAAAPEVGAVLERLDRIEGDLSMLGDMLNDREIERDEYRRRVKELTASKRAARAELEASSLPVAITTDPGTLIEKWDSLTVEEKRANIVALVANVSIKKPATRSSKVFDPDRVVIDWTDGVLAG